MPIAIPARLSLRRPVDGGVVQLAAGTGEVASAAAAAPPSSDASDVDGVEPAVVKPGAGAPVAAPGYGSSGTTIHPTTYARNAAPPVSGTRMAHAIRTSAGSVFR